MAKKGRRLPGGKVRKPPARVARPQVAAGRGRGVEAAEPRPEALASVESARAAVPAAMPARASSDSVARTGRSPAPSLPRRPTGAAVAARAARPSLMDLTAASYSHIRSDLVRIAVLATIMLATIVILSFVIK